MQMGLLNQYLDDDALAESMAAMNRHPALPTGDGPRLEGHGFWGAKVRSDVQRFVDWYMDGKIDIDPMITHKLTLDQINEGFDLLYAAKSIRAEVEF